MFVVWMAPRAMVHEGIPKGRLLVKPHLGRDLQQGFPLRGEGVQHRLRNLGRVEAGGIDQPKGIQHQVADDLVHRFSGDLLHREAQNHVVRVRVGPVLTRFEEAAGILADGDDLFRSPVSEGIGGIGGGNASVVT